MRSVVVMPSLRSTISFAIVFALALAAVGCGARTDSAEPPPNVQQPAVSAHADGCGTRWTLVPQSHCTWMIGFTGDPMKCVGVADGRASAAQCREVCGQTDAGDVADTCVIGWLGDSPDWRADCTKTTGPACSQ